MSGNKKNKIYLKDIPKQNNFKVPDGYFDSFDRRLMEKIKENEKKETIQLPGNRWSAFRSQIALAASLVVFVVISYVVINFILSNNLKQTDSIEYAELLQYEVSKLDESYLMETYSKEQAEITPGEEDMDYTEAIIEYLASEDIDLDLIAENF